MCECEDGAKNPVINIIAMLIEYFQTPFSFHSKSEHVLKLSLRTLKVVTWQKPEEISKVVLVRIKSYDVKPRSMLKSKLRSYEQEEKYSRPPVRRWTFLND